MVEYDPKNQNEEYVTAVPVTAAIRVPQVPVPQLDISNKWWCLSMALKQQEREWLFLMS